MADLEYIEGGGTKLEAGCDVDAIMRHWSRVRPIGPYPVFNCGALTGGLNLAVGLRTASDIPIVGVHARSIIKHVAITYLDALDKAYRVFANRHAVHSVQFTGWQAAEWREQGGGTSRSTKVYLDDVRAVYVLLSEQLRNRLVRETSDALARVLRAGLVMLNRMAKNVSLHPSVVAHVGGNPFQMFNDLDDRVIDMLRRCPVDYAVINSSRLNIPVAAVRGGGGGPLCRLLVLCRLLPCLLFLCRRLLLCRRLQPCLPIQCRRLLLCRRLLPCRLRHR